MEQYLALAPSTFVPNVTHCLVVEHDYSDVTCETILDSGGGNSGYLLPVDYLNAGCVGINYLGHGTTYEWDYEDNHQTRSYLTATLNFYNGTDCTDAYWSTTESWDLGTPSGLSPEGTTYEYALPTCNENVLSSNVAAFELTIKCQCPAGTYNDDTSCTHCAKGYYSNVADSDECLACPVGRSAYTYGMSECEECDAGMTAPEEGSSLCSTMGEFGTVHHDSASSLAIQTYAVVACFFAKYVAN